MTAKKWNKADYMLLAAGALFALAAALKIIYPADYKIRILLITAEACLVGGVADWFATEALFRRPLGISYHSALVPRNKGRLIESLAKAVEHDFFNKEVLRNLLYQTKVTDWLIARLQNRRVLFFVRKVLLKLVGHTLLALEPKQLGRHGEEIIKSFAKASQPAAYLAKLSKWALDTGKIALLYNFIIDELAILAAKPETQNKIYNYLKKFKTENTSSNLFSNFVTWVMEKSNSLNLDDASQVLQAEILTALKNAKEEDSPVRKWFLWQLEKAIKDLPENEAWVNALEVWKEVFFAKLDLASPISATAHSFKELATDSTSASAYQDQIVDFLLEQAQKYWPEFKNNGKMKEELDGFFHYLADTLLESKHNLVGTVVTNTLERLTDEDLVKFVEEKTAGDLAWIRINGVIVGGVAGFILGLFLHFIYDPYIIPFFKSLATS